MVVTGLSVAVAPIIGMVELLQVRSTTIFFLAFDSVTKVLPYIDCHCPKVAF
jgi:high-affinity nickel permease